MQYFTFVISPNNKPGSSDRKEVTVIANDVAQAKEKVKKMYPDAFFYGGVRIQQA